MNQRIQELITQLSSLSAAELRDTTYQQLLEFRRVATAVPFPNFPSTIQANTLRVYDETGCAVVFEAELT